MEVQGEGGEGEDVGDGGANEGRGEIRGDEEGEGRPRHVAQRQVPARSPHPPTPHT